MFPITNNESYGPMVLIARFFDLKTADFKIGGCAAGLTDKDKAELASAAARHYNVPKENLKFDPVEY